MEAVAQQRLLSPRSFTIPGKPRGYYAAANRHRSTRKIQYWNWCDFVRQCATDAGVPLPLFAVFGSELRVDTKAYFKNKVHPDPENVHKGIKDALFFESIGGDKYTEGFYTKPLYDEDNPRVEVIIRPLTELDSNDISYFLVCPEGHGEKSPINLDETNRICPECSLPRVWSYQLTEQ